MLPGPAARRTWALASRSSPRSTSGSVRDPDAPLVGAVTGLLAGAYLALRAAGIEPVEALGFGT